MFLLSIKRQRIQTEIHTLKLRNGVVVEIGSTEMSQKHWKKFTSKLIEKNKMSFRRKIVWL